MGVTCNVIRDLMPSFVDEICSEDSKDLINEHIQTCKPCKDFLESMKQPISSIDLNQENDKLKAQKPFKKINEIYRIKIILVAITVMAMTIIGMIVVTNVGIIYDFLFPHQISVINEKDSIEEWKAISLEGNQYLNYDSIFYKKRVTNNANSTKSIKMRILDKEGNTILDELIIEPGTAVDLNKLKRNVDYIVEIWIDAGYYMLYFN